MRSWVFTIRTTVCASVIGLMCVFITPYALAQTSYPSTDASPIAARPTVAPTRLTIGPATGPQVGSTNAPTLTAPDVPVLKSAIMPPEGSAIRRTESTNPQTNNISQAGRADHYSDPMRPAVAASLAAGEEESLPVIRIASPIQFNLAEPSVGPQSISEATDSAYPSTTTPDLNIATPPQATPSPLPMLRLPKINEAAPSDHSLAPLFSPPMSGATTPSQPLLSAAPLFPPDSKPTDQLTLVESAMNQGLPLISLPATPANSPGALYLAAPNTDAGPAIPPPFPAEDRSEAPPTQSQQTVQNPLPTTSPTLPAASPTATAAETPSTDESGNGVMEYGGYDQLSDGCGDVYDPHAYFDSNAFSPDPSYDHIPYNSVAELGIYEGKWNMCSQRPLIELGRGVYRNGVVPKSYSFLGKKNLITPGFTLFGDFRTAVAANDNGVGDHKFVWANRLNLDFDLRLTATERIHAFWGPIDEDGRFTRVESFTDGRNDLKFFEEFDDDFDTLFFEGDLGYMYGGMTDQWAPFDLPFVAGKFPLLFQNGVWINDAVEGFAFTLPAKNSRRLNWSNFDLTMFFLFDDIDSAAFLGDDNAADAYGFNLFVEAYGGYTEAGYAFLDDRAGLGRSYHNMTIGHTRRFRQRLSNSVRVIVNSGQDPNDGVKTADGQLLIIENSLVSSNPTYFVPYANFFAGFGTPKNLAGQPVLQNVGINFETDALTGFPKLNDQAQDTWGGAFGFNLLGPRFSWQWILEASMVQNFGDSISGDEYAVGTRIQKSLNYAWLARIDAMYGLREKESDLSGVRAELRWKF